MMGEKISTCILIGLVSFIMGALFFANIQVKDDKKSVARGIIELDHEFYKLTPLEK